MSIYEESLKLNQSKWGHPVRQATSGFKNLVVFFRENPPLLLSLVCLFFLLAGWLGERSGALSPNLISAFATLAYATGGILGAKSAFESMRKGALGIDFLMLAAAAGAALIGEWPEGALLLFLFTLSGALETFAMDRTRDAIKALSELRPETAQRLVNGIETSVPIHALTRLDVVVVRPGDRIPVDGEVRKGQSSVDQSPITGESIPVSKTEGDEVFAGTINGGGALEVKVTTLASQSTLSRIIQLVEEAQEDAVPAQRFIDRFSQPYTWFVLLLTGVVFAIPQGFGQEEFSHSLYRAMTLLVVASPCALVISTPASILSAITAAARQGVLFKGGVHLENLAKVNITAFDKTGTLTRGQPIVTDIIGVTGFSEEELLRLAASAESLSEHHIARALASEAESREIHLEKPTEFEAKAGKGVRAVIGRTPIWVGNDKLFSDMRPPLAKEVLATGKALQTQGKTTILVARETSIGNLEPLGFIAIADTLRAGVAQDIEALREEGITQVVMLTGDNRDVAQAIGSDAGISTIYSELLPHEKVDVLKELRAKGFTLMVGDGINDAPALATADVGVAMGVTGTDAALETADLVLMGDRLSKLPFALKLARRARKTVKQNVIFSIGVMLLLMTLTVLVPLVIKGFQLPLPLGVVGHEGSTLLVIANGLRLLAIRPASESLAETNPS